MKLKLFAFILLFTLNVSCSDNNESKRDWSHFVRISGNPLTYENAADIVKRAQESLVFGIETDNDITGRYDSFIDPEQKLEAIRQVTKLAHDNNNYTFVYIAGLECITENSDQTEHTFLKDHPDWVQRNRKGEPAVFSDKDAFWITAGDEDVWISPYPPEWRKKYMQHVRSIAETGIDGIYVDIPYWMTHFEGWEDTWASFDKYTLEAFQKTYQINAMTDFDLGDFNNPKFRKWVDFRINTITEFMKEINNVTKSVNPECKVIAEIYPGIDFEAVRVGADVYQLYNVVDVVAHEYSEGAYMASDREPLDWIDYMIGMFTFRAFAEDKPTWMLSYSWDGAKKIKPADAMKNLFMAQTMAGANSWDAQGHIMSRSNDLAARKQIYKWIKDNEQLIYSKRETISPIGIYFSAQTRNYFSEEHINSFRGIMHLFLQSHIEFQIVTPRIIDKYEQKTLILPDVRCISEKEKIHLKNIEQLIFTGETGSHDDTGLKLDKISKSEFDKNFAHATVLKDYPGKKYYELCRENYDKGAHSGEQIELLNKFRNGFLKNVSNETKIKIDSSPYLISQTAKVQGNPTIFFANFKGLIGKENANQISEENIKIRIKSDVDYPAYFLSYLGKTENIKTEKNNGWLICEIPQIKRGGIFWIDRNGSNKNN